MCGSHRAAARRDSTSRENRLRKLAKQTADLKQSSYR